MGQQFKVDGRKKIFYGWVALAGSMLTAFLAGGCFLYAFGVFMPVMSEEFGWSRGVISVGFSMGLLALGLPGPYTSRTTR